MEKIIEARYSIKVKGEGIDVNFDVNFDEQKLMGVLPVLQESIQEAKVIIPVITQAIPEVTKLGEVFLKVLEGLKGVAVVNTKVTTVKKSKKSEKRFDITDEPKTGAVPSMSMN